MNSDTNWHIFQDEQLIFVLIIYVIHLESVLSHLIGFDWVAFYLDHMEEFSWPNAL